MCELYTKIYILTYLTQSETASEQFVMQEQHQWLAASLDDIFKYIKNHKLNRFSVDCQAVQVSQLEEILAQQSSSAQ